MTKTLRGFSDWLIFWLAGADLGEAITGDLSEQRRQPYAIAYLRSLPGLIHLSWNSLSSTRIRLELFLISLAISLAWLWEAWIAQIYAWPIASSLQAISPLSIVATCKLAYLGLFTIGVALLLSGWVLVNAMTRSNWRVRVHRFMVWGFAGLSPVIFLLLNPGPYDGDPLFRYIQVGLIGAIGTWTAFNCRASLRPA